MMSRAGIRRLSIAFGNQKTWYRDLPDIEERIQRLKIPDEEELWSWGYCWRSTEDYAAHVTRGLAGLQPWLATEGIEIDAVIGCEPFQNDPGRFASVLVQDVLPRLGVGEERLQLVRDRECVNILQALADAKALLASGRENILILAAESMEEERERFRKYSLFSDFSLALLVSRRLEHCAYEVCDVLVEADPAPGEDTSRILGRNIEKESVSRVLTAHGLSFRDVDRFFYLNLFQPIAEMKGKDMGFRVSQLYTDLSRDFAHCSGADPLINLQTYVETGGTGDTFVLCASGRAHAGVSLVRRRGDAC